MNYPIINNVPVFLNVDSSYKDDRKNPNPTNPYSEKNLAIIKNNPDKLILDFGAGNPKKNELFDNVVRLDYVHYANNDIVFDMKNLPFKDETFDYVISESVFEHLKDPWHYAQEIYRVLKKGGQVTIDTAFLYGLHGDPYHFYNMTIYGLEDTFKMFKKIRSGVEPYQTSGITLNILTNTFLSLISDESARQELKGKLSGIAFHEYDKYLSDESQKVMSAGVYFIGKKTGCVADKSLNELQVQRDELQTRIQAMESSKFWKMRKLWFKLKRIIGISVNE